MGVHKTISFRMDADKVKALDQAAAHIQRDRTFLLNEAVDAWLDLHEYQSRLIDGGIKAAEEGQFCRQYRDAHAAGGAQEEP